MILLMKSEYGLETSWTGSISMWTHQITAPLIGTRIYRGWELEKLVYRWIVQAGLPVHYYTACMDHLQWVWLWCVTVVMLVYTNVLRWLRESVFHVTVHERRQLLWRGLHIMTLHVCRLQICKHRWNRYLCSCAAMWKTLSPNTFVYTDMVKATQNVSGNLTKIYGAASGL